MSALSNYAEDALLNHLTGQTAFALPDVYIALYTSAPSDASAGTEVSGVGYARLSADGVFGAASNGSITTVADLEWPAAGSNWGNVVAAALTDAASGGNILVYGPAASSKNIESGDTYRIQAGNLTITLD